VEKDARARRDVTLTKRDESILISPIVLFVQGVFYHVLKRPHRERGRQTRNATNAGGCTENPRLQKTKQERSRHKK
jgi:hypothetical protein